MLKILIVDDDTNIIDVVKSRLEKNNYEVVSANNGQQGITMAQQESPDLIVMDIMMPQLPGSDAVKILREDVSVKCIPIIFLTALASHRAKNGKINVNGQLFTAVAKPFEPDKLLSAIRELIGDE